MQIKKKLKKKKLGKSSGLIIDSVIENNVNTSKYNPLPGSSYVKLTKELDHLRKGLINIQKFDYNECFKWSLARYLNPENHCLARSTEAAEKFANKPDFKDIKLLVKVRDIHKIEEKEFH